MDSDIILQILTSLTQSVHNQTKEIHNYAKEMQNHAKKVQNQAKEVSELKKQMGQVAEFMGQFREQGKLPTSTIVNPRGRFETVKAITLRSGKEVGTDPQSSKSSQKKNEKLLLEEEEVDKATTRVEQPLPQPLSPLCRPKQPR